MRTLKITKKITQRDVSDSFKRYLQEVNNIKPFESVNDEYECAMLAYNGDEKAKHELITRNLRFVISVAKKHQHENASLQDLVNCGNIGLIEAANRFEPTRGFKFISYGVWWIRKSIMEYVNNEVGVIRLPINKVNNLNTLKKISSTLEQENQRNVTVNDLLDCENVNLTERQILDYEYSSNIVVNSLDVKMSNSIDDATFIDMFEDENSLKPDHIFHNEDIKIISNMCFGLLNDKEIMVLKHLYGIDGYKVLNTTELGEILGITNEGVRLIHKKSLNKINKHLTNFGYDVGVFNLV